MEASPALETFIKGWESCCLTPYRDQAGLWTVGWGHLMQQTDPRVPLTQPEADSLFLLDLLPTVNHVDKLVYMPVEQHQFDALVSFAFNAGDSALAGSTLLKRVNGGYFDQAADEFLRWDKVTVNGAKVVSSGLHKRRVAERDIFMDADYSGRP